MKILLVTYGSRGDVQPVIALDGALRDAGHDVVLAGPPEHESWACSHHCVYRPIGGNFKASISGFPDPHTPQAALGFIRVIRQEVIQQFGQLPVEVNHADLVLGTSLVFAAHSAAELAGVPYGFIALCPQILPSAQHPPLFVKNHSLPPWMNAIAWRVGFRLDNLTIRGLINQERRRLGLPDVGNAWHHLLGKRVLVASDTALGGVPKDVCQQVCQAGHFALASRGTLSYEVEKFLESGPPPLYAGFGSMFSRKPGKILALVVQAARAAGRRVILARGWSEGADENPGEDCMVVDETPHSLLFPRVAAVVHHGGSGTTAAAARAGVPQVIVPHILDQYYWASAVWTKGVGPKPIPRNRLSPKRLSAAMQECLKDERIRQCAEDLGHRLRNENGLSLAVDAIQSGFFHGGARPRE